MCLNMIKMSFLPFAELDPKPLGPKLFEKAFAFACALDCPKDWGDCWGCEAEMPTKLCICESFKFYEFLRYEGSSS
jgi:hypothetical protein